MNNGRKPCFARSQLMKSIIGLLAVIMLALSTGCGMQDLTSAVLPSVPTAEFLDENPSEPVAEIETGDQPAPAPDAGEARQTVVDFLTAVQLDANSSLALQLLTMELQMRAAQSEGLQAALLKTTESIPSFEVSAAGISHNGAQAEVEATLYLEYPLNIAFTLIAVDGFWKIGEIRPLATGEEYPGQPEGVVQAFLIAYQERPDQMSGYLTAARRANQPPGGSVGMLRILGPLEGVMIQSVVVNPDPPTAAIQALIKSGGVESRRQFILIRDGGLWGIDEIQTVD